MFALYEVQLGHFDGCPSCFTSLCFGQVIASLVPLSSYS